MRISIFIIVVVLFFASIANSQNLDKFGNQNGQANLPERDIIAVDKSDVAAASQENASVFRILPRGKYDNGISAVNGAGSYYSFYFRIPDYGHGSDIELSDYKFSVGFAGADFGFLTDLGNKSLASLDKESKGISFLNNYEVPKEENKAREEHRRGRKSGFSIDGVNYQNRIPAIVGHSYAVRSVNYNYSDVLAVFKVYRKDTDDSLIIFWKMIGQYDTPSLRSSGKPRPSDEEILKSVKQSFARLFPDAQMEVNDGVVTLRGTVPKDKLAYIIQLANGAGARKVVNLLEIR